MVDFRDFLNVLQGSKSIQVNESPLIKTWEAAIFPRDARDVAFFAQWESELNSGFIELTVGNIEAGSWVVQNKVFSVTDDSGESFTVTFEAGGKLVLVA